MTTILQDKWKEIAERALISGQGDLEKGLCVMQAVDYISSGGLSDHPECACAILTNYAIALNDRFNDKDRQKLKPLIPLLVGTLSDDKLRIARKRFIMWRNVTVTYPLILDLFKVDEYAKVLREVPNTIEGMESAANYLKENREAIRKIANANAYANAYADAYADANAYAYADANAYANAYADAYAYANAYANAYAYADAYAYAYAKKIRTAIADSAVETLRLAIEVKE